MAGAAAGQGGQLPLALRYPPDQRLDTFVAAPQGALAQLRAIATGEGGDGAPDRPVLDWLYLAGAAGTGKTHLALAACAEADAAHRRSAYVPLAAAAGRLREALAALHDYDLIALDGLDAVVGERDDEIALFDFHNRAFDAGKAVLYTARQAPDALGLVLPDLRSRLSQCARINLSALDDEGRREMLRLRAQRRGLVLEDAAIDWLLRRVGRDLAGLAALLDTLDRASLAAQRRITVPFLRQTLDAAKAE
ncbi:DnaA regulatory inactivator Hda [Luteimonas aquatica]|uniref:DnaA regulatory inactivator Hda n=1 Tax=Luteimonas aquatica TaxID=450364 RepID=UPI001F59E634|nr:DnaA regulatory inactivator Hda [Luteimonas aquatica]